jgi:DNA-directed RNA polymerase subunit RPC12/RpoP
MSIERCSICEREVDTDFDDSGVYYQGEYVCDRCSEDWSIGP